MSKKLYTGEILITFQDQTTAVFQIYRDSNIDYSAIHAISDSCMQLIADEIAIQRKKVVLNWGWVEISDTIPNWLISNLVNA